MSELNLCDLVTSLTVGAQSNPPDYLYTGTSPSASFSLSPTFVSAPEVNCVNIATYTCSNTGPRIDMCTEGTFDANTGDYTFSSTDTALYPQGTYTFTITAVLGN